MNKPISVANTGAVEEGSQPRRDRSRIAFGLRVGLGLGLLSILFYLYGFRRITGILARERLEFFVAALALYLAGQVMSAYRWMLLARLNGLAGRWREYLAYYFIGMFTNLFVPA